MSKIETEKLLWGLVELELERRGARVPEAQMHFFGCELHARSCPARRRVASVCDRPRFLCASSTVCVCV